MIVNVVYMATSRTGGWVSFTSHLLHGLQLAGHDVRLYRLGKRSEAHTRPYGMGFEYQNVSAPMLEYLAGQPDQPMIVSASWAPNASTLGALLGMGAKVIIHDPTEIHGAKQATAEALTTAKPGHVIIVRRSMHKHLPQAVYVPHPYMRCPDLKRELTCHAVAFSRLDWDKYTHVIAAANRLLPEGRQVLIYGTENRLYTHHKITAEVPDWRHAYRGPMPRTDLWAGARLAASASYSVDLSVIAGDGGGTQYTFLEALDAGSRLIINSKWMTGQPDIDEMAGHALTVTTPADLAELLSRPMPQPPAPSASALLARHDAAVCAQQMLET